MKWPKANVMDEESSGRKKANVSKFEDLQKKKKERSRHQQEGGGTFSFRHFSHVNFHDVKHSPPHSSMTRNLSCLSILKKYPPPPRRNPKSFPALFSTAAIAKSPPDLISVY
mgnify:CR=1 FL=1